VLVAAALLAGLVIGLLVGRSRARDAGAPVAEPVVPAPRLSSQLEAAVDLMRSASLVAGPHDEVWHSNPPARTTGLVRGSRVAPDELLELVRSVRQRGQAVGTTLQLKREPGVPTRELAVRVSLLEGGIVLVIADDRSAETRADEIKRDFVANVSHELKTPVGAIQVLSEAVEQAADDPEAIRRFAGRMTRETERLGELVQQIIELSRLQSVDPLIQADVVEVDDIVGAAVARCRELASGRAITLTLAGAQGLRVVGDEDQLTSAVVNLVQNAINYSDPGARVAMSTRAVEDGGDEFVEISVADNGIGIRADDLERIFERFYRVDYDRSRQSGGTGLGLSIVKHVAGAHGGTVNVWSKVGQGSTFTLRLPAYLETEEPEVTALTVPMPDGGMQ